MNKTVNYAETVSERGISAVKITPELYSDMSKQASPKSKSWINIPMAFLTGGIICTIGEALNSLFESAGLEKTECGMWTSVLLVAASALLTGFNLYEKLARHAGAGTLVPITGFANAVVSSALEAKSEGYILGVGAKIFTIAGPVILYGTAASVVYGCIYYFLM